MRLKFPQAFDLARDNQILIAAQRDAMLCGKALSPLRHKIHMRAVAKNLAGSAHGIRDPLYATHASAAQRGAVHDEGIELDLALPIEKAAAPGVERLIILHDDNSFFDGIER